MTQAPDATVGDSRPCFKCGFPEYPSHHDPKMPQWEDHPYEADVRYPPRIMAATAKVMPPTTEPRTEAGPTCTCTELNRRLMAHLLRVPEGDVHEAGCWDRAFAAGRAEALGENVERLREYADEQAEVWLQLERNIWPRGPAHGSGSGFYAVFKGRLVARLRAALADPQNAEHVDRADCWCQPVRDYKDPVTETEVWVHRDIVS